MNEKETYYKVYADTDDTCLIRREFKDLLEVDYFLSYLRGQNIGYVVVVITREEMDRHRSF